MHRIFKPIIVIGCIVGFFAFCVYAYNYQEQRIDTQAEKDLVSVAHERDLFRAAYSHLPNETKTTLFLTEMAREFPNEKVDDLAKVLGIEIKKDSVEKEQR